MTAAYLGVPRRRRPVESSSAPAVDGDAAVLALLARREGREAEGGDEPLSAVDVLLERRAARVETDSDGAGIAVDVLLDRRAARELPSGHSSDDYGTAGLLARREARSVPDPAPDVDSSDSSVARLLARRHTEV